MTPPYKRQWDTRRARVSNNLSNKDERRPLRYSYATLDNSNLASDSGVSRSGKKSLLFLYKLSFKQQWDARTLRLRQPSIQPSSSARAAATSRHPRASALYGIATAGLSCAC